MITLYAAIIALNVSTNTAMVKLVKHDQRAKETTVTVKAMPYAQALALTKKARR